MNILLLAPQPFYRERGTPIAVKLLIETLCEAGNNIDLLTYHEGEDISIHGLNIYRIRKPPFVKNIPIGLSWKKVMCDLFLMKKMLKMMKQKTYQVVHAVEEAIFLGIFVKQFFKFKLIYDMDSSLVDQLIGTNKILGLFKKTLYKTEAWAIRGSDFAIPVCQNLADKVMHYMPEKNICILQDIPFESANDLSEVETLRDSLKIKDCLALYVGNLEQYQGIDLIIEGMAKIPLEYRCDLVVIGGINSHIKKYTSIVKRLGLSEKVHFLGPRPLSNLALYLAQADILLSFRTKGDNTPMKIYSYLSSGKPVLASKVKSHAQVMDASCAMLVDPTPDSIARGFTALIRDPNLRHRLGKAGQDLVQKKYSRKVYRKKLLDFYATVTPAVRNH